MNQSSDIQASRFRLFWEGYRRGCLTLAEIDEALPPGTERPEERWLTIYCLRAIGVRVVRDAERSVGKIG